MRLIK
jgi:hypothetical protein